ncbi:uncharacterized protein LOC126900225 isoform X2 [Daktulosphaira vitifoliae]|uniref:uncharacterized protein LOC126900225 isoform X2 n=1 Tax=Daktulosphaira vitifoliae TaxID=58002 RepID=UPI0021AA675B|nr:uncharacterized protein LOC126900225 isoform X2 [Daktulosphaira vitifoliae]
MLGSSMHHHRNMSFPHGGSVIHNAMPPSPVSKKSVGSGRLNAVVNKLHLAKQCTSEPVYPEMIDEHNSISILHNLLNPSSSPSLPPSSNIERKTLRAPPALFPLTSEVTIQRYPIIHPVNDRPLDVFQRLKRLGTDIEMEEIHNNETTLSIIPTPVASSQSAPKSISSTMNYKTNSPATSLIVMPKTNVFNNRKIPEPSVVLEVKVTPKQQKAQTQNISSCNTKLKNFEFSIDQSQIRVTNNGHKLYSCNICSGIYQRRGALKKHYLKAHINYHYLTSRDLQIAGFRGERLDKMLDKWKDTNGQIGYYHCHKCCLSFDTPLELRRHVSNHPPPVILHTLAVKKLSDVVTKVCELCLYCDKKIENEDDRKTHLSKVHPPKRRCHICIYCQFNFFDLYTLHKHMCTLHEDVYYGCAECKERFLTRELAKNHKSICLNNLCIKLKPETSFKKEEFHYEEPIVELIELKVEEHKTVDIKKEPHFLIEELQQNEELSKKEEIKKKDDTKEYPYYCPDCNKGFTQQPNLARHMSLGHGKKLEYKKTTKKLLQTISKVILPKKPIVKIQEKELKDEIQDLSAKGTQFVFLNNKNELVTKQGVPFDISFMNLEIQNRIKRMVPSLNPNSSLSEDDMTLGSLEADAASSYGYRSPHDPEREKLEGFSGEWLYPRTYICSACPMKCSNIWDIYYHKWNAHPNVLCHHFDIPIDQLPTNKWRPERNLSRIGLLSECEELKTELQQCSKCGKTENDIAQLHRHLLDCGGDTEWLKTMVHTTKSPNSKKSRKNWRPFNFRRRKNGRARHGLKRTPPTPPLPVVKTKPGDAESVSRMIADLPPKRVTRRLVFETPNGNNQATINSVPYDMSRNLTISSSTTYSKKIKKPLPLSTETANLISEAPDFLRKLNIMRAPPKQIEQTTGPFSKNETEEIIAAMKETLMASPAPTPVVLPKKRKRILYDFKQLAEKIAKHDHNEILDPDTKEIENTDTPIEETVVRIPTIKKKGKNLMNEVQVDLIKQNRLRRKRNVPEKGLENPVVPLKKSKFEPQTKLVKNIAPEKEVKAEVIQINKKKTKKITKKVINEKVISKIQTRNSKKNTIAKSSSLELDPLNEKSLNNESFSNFIDLESSQELCLTEIIDKKKVTKVNPFKPKPKHRRKPGIFFGSRKRKRTTKTENKTQSSANKLNVILKNSQCSDTLVVEVDSKEQILSNSEEIFNELVKSTTPLQEKCLNSDKNAQNDSKVQFIDKVEAKAITPFSADATESKEPEEIAEPRWHSQSDSFFDIPSTISLGSILSSVNKILEGPDSNVSNSDENDYSWSELQRAMGATDEEMAILQNFGTNPAQENQEVNGENNMNFIDLDCRQEACTNNEDKTEKQDNTELNFKCKVCDQCYKGIAAFRIHSLDVHSIEDPELVNVIKSDNLLVCWVCKLIMEGGSEELEEHMVKDHEFDDANGENGKELKNKMVNKLGEILDQALKNLISSTQKPSIGKIWSGGAITLLGKLCALRNNEKGTTVSSSIANSALAKDLRKVIGRNGNGANSKPQSKKWQSAHALRQNARLAALSEAAQRLTPIIDSDDSSSIYKCPICNIGFETTSTRNKHISRAHNGPKKSTRLEISSQTSDTNKPASLSEETAEPPAKVHPMFTVGALNRRGLKKFNSTCGEEVRARAKQALRDLEIKSRLKHYTFSGDQPPPS